MSRRKYILTVGIAIALTGAAVLAFTRNGDSERRRFLRDQDPWKVLEKISKAYDSGMIRQQSGEARLYKPQAPSSILERIAFTSCMGKDRYYLRLGAVESYVDSLVSIVADSTLKTVTISPGLSDLPTVGNFDWARLKQLMVEEEAKLVIVEENEKTFLSYNSSVNPDMRNCRMYFDPINFRMSRVMMEIPQQPGEEEEESTLIVEIDYKPLAHLSVFPASLTSARFIEKVKDSLRLQPAYASFELVDDTK